MRRPAFGRSHNKPRHGRTKEMTMSKMKLKLISAGVVVGCALGLLALRDALATPPSPGFTSTTIVGPALLDDVDTKSETDDHEVEIKTKGFSDVYVTGITIPPGGHGGWHSHPGPSIIAVKSGEATLYDDCDDFLIPHVYSAGNAFVEDAECVHLLTNEGDTDLEVIVIQIVPEGAPRRINEPAP
jgi:quercetin dioxygenase-like cupin family protein